MSKLTNSISLLVLLFMVGCSSANDVIGTEKTRPTEADGLVVMKANAEEEAALLWNAYGLNSEMPAVSFKEQALFFIGLYESGSCPYELDDIKTAVDDVTLTIDLEESTGVCTDDQSPRTFYVAAPRNIETVVVKGETVRLNQFDEEKKRAKTFLEEKGWGKQAADIALAQTVEDPQYAEWVDSPVKGELVAVSFLEKESSVIGVPVVYVDPESNKVAGYMPGE